jgi:hypothetical protein
MARRASGAATAARSNKIQPLLAWTPFLRRQQCSTTSLAK